MSVTEAPPVSAFNRVPPHLVWRDALPAEEHHALLEWVLANDGQFHLPGKVGEGRVAAEIRNNRVCAHEHSRPWRRRLRGQLKPLLLDIAGKIGITVRPDDRLELELTSYGDGCFYRRHIDTAVGPSDASAPRPSSRILSAIYYFHRQPRGFSGGELRLRPIDPRAVEIYSDISIEDNMLLVFPAWVPHEVLPVQCPSADFADTRFAVNCWVHRARPIKAAAATD